MSLLHHFTVVLLLFSLHFLLLERSVNLFSSLAPHVMCVWCACVCDVNALWLIALFSSSLSSPCVSFVLPQRVAVKVSILMFASIMLREVAVALQGKKKTLLILTSQHITLTCISDNFMSWTLCALWVIAPLLREAASVFT